MIGQHFPNCNERCDGVLLNEHWLEGWEPDLSELRGLTSAGAATLVVNGVAYIRQDALMHSAEAGRP